MASKAKIVYDKLASTFQYVIENADGTSSSQLLSVVLNIAERDAIKNPAGLVWVLDASDDPKIGSGGAIYGWDSRTRKWVAVASSSSMDGVKVIVRWEEIENKPTSAPASIDAAVRDMHAHGNKSLLDTLTSDSIHTHANKSILDQITAASGYFHKHGNLSTLERLTNGDVTRLKAITDDQIASFHRHSNLSVLERLSINASGNLLIDGAAIKAGVQLKTHNFMHYEGESPHTFQFTTLKVAAVYDAICWGPGTVASEYVKANADVITTDTALKLDLSGFPEGSYQIRYLCTE